MTKIIELEKRLMVATWGRCMDSKHKGDLCGDAICFLSCDGYMKSTRMFKWQRIYTQNISMSISGLILYYRYEVTTGGR